MARSLASLSFGSMLRRWLPLASCGMMLTCGTGTGTGNAALLDPDSFSSLGTATLSGEIRLDFSGSSPVLRSGADSSVLYTGTYAGGVAVFSFEKLSVAPGADLRVQFGQTGAPVALLSRGDIAIAGTIDFAAGGATPGPGGGAGGAGGAPGMPGQTGAGPSPGSGGLVTHYFDGIWGEGGGGGGFGGAGGRSGASPGGPAVPASLVDAFTGGSGGGGSGGFDNVANQVPGGAGGGGGGALQLVALDLLSLLPGAVISVDGGFGETGGGPGGGGSGGGLLLVGDQVELRGTLSARGGGGPSGSRGSYGGGGGGGKIEVLYETAFVNAGVIDLTGGPAPATMAEDSGEEGTFLARRRTTVAVDAPGTLLLFGAGLLVLSAALRRLSRG